MTNLRFPLNNSLIIMINIGIIVFLVLIFFVIRYYILLIKNK